MDYTPLADRKLFFSTAVGLTLIFCSTVLLSRYRSQHSVLVADNLFIWALLLILGIALLSFSLKIAAWRRISIRAAACATFSAIIAVSDPTTFGRIAIAFVYSITLGSIIHRYRTLLASHPS